MGTNYFLWKISLVVFFGILIKVYTDLESFGIVFLLLAVFIFLTSFAEVQRLHDLDRPGIQFWLLFIPIFNIYLSLVLFIKKGSDGLNQYGIDPLKREVKYGQYISPNEVLREMGVGAEKKTVDHPNSSIGMNESSLWKFDTKDKSNKKEQIKNPFNRKSQQKGNEATGQFSEPSQMAVIDEERIYAFIADEIDAGAIDKGLWTRLFVECDGDEKQTKVLYIKQRAKRLIQAEQARMEQEEKNKHGDIQEPQNGKAEHGQIWTCVCGTKNPYQSENNFQVCSTCLRIPPQSDYRFRCKLTTHSGTK